MKEAFLSDDGLRSLFTVLFVAMCLTVYELYTFFYVVTPTVKKQVDSSLKKMSSLVRENIQQKTDDVFNTGDYELPDQVKQVKNVFLSVFNTTDDREQILTDKINGYTKATGALIILSLAVCILVIRYVLNSRGQQIGTCAWVMAFVTLGLIIMFQYAFFLYGQEYKYMGSAGNEELVNYLFKKL